MAVKPSRPHGKSSGGSKSKKPATKKPVTKSRKGASTRAHI